MVFKCVNVFVNLKKMKKSFEALESLLILSDTRGEREELRMEVKLCYKVFKVFRLSVILTCVVACFPPFITHQLPYKVWFPFDSENSEIGFWAAAAIMIFIAPYIMSIDLALDILPVIYISFAIGVITELAGRLEKIGLQKVPESLNGSTKDDFQRQQEKLHYDELVQCTKIHAEIKNYINRVERNFVAVLMIQGMLSSIILCTTAFTMAIVKLIFHCFSKVYGNFLLLNLDRGSLIILSSSQLYSSSGFGDFPPMLLWRSAFSCLFEDINSLISFELDQRKC